MINELIENLDKKKFELFQKGLRPERLEITFSIDGFSELLTDLNVLDAIDVTATGIGTILGYKYTVVKRQEEKFIIIEVLNKKCEIEVLPKGKCGE